MLRRTITLSLRRSAGEPIETPSRSGREQEVWRVKRRQRLLGLLLLLGIVAATKLGQQLYGWFAYAEERSELQALSTRLEGAGLEVIRTQLGADSLRSEIERMDADLAARKREVGAFERHVRDGALPAHLYESYRTELGAYNRRVEGRNDLFGRWKETVFRNHAAVTRYNALADSIRGLAARIGEPYFQIPSPVELAVERGLIGEGK
jgi:hypothetical protein